MQDLTFIATQEKGEVSALHLTPANPKALFVFAHGAGANIQHQHMQSLALSLCQQNIATLRYNFPYMERGGGRTDNLETCLETIGNAITLGRSIAPDLPLFLAGHSFGGRMSSHYAAAFTTAMDGIVYFSFPLHPAKKPATHRADHLINITVPQLFVSGSRDTLAYLDLLEPIIKGLPHATHHVIDTADHSFKVLKRTRLSTEDVYDEAARVVESWLDGVMGSTAKKAGA